LLPIPLVREFLNEAWNPLCSIDVADEMATSGIRYLGSATLADNHAALVIDEAASGICFAPADV
jgi:hypothetical protein